MMVKEHPKLDDYLFLKKKYHKVLQPIIEVYQRLIVAERFELEYAVS